MTAPEDVCRNLVEDVDGALGCAVVDLNTGLIESIHHVVSYIDNVYLDAVAAAAVDMFRGRSVLNIERLLSKKRGEEVSNTFEEIQIKTTRTYHFMSVIPSQPDYLFVFITDHSVNLGMGWASVRTSLKRFEQS